MSKNIFINKSVKKQQSSSVEIRLMFTLLIKAVEGCQPQGFYNIFDA